MPLTAVQIKRIRHNRGIVHSRLVSLLIPAGNTVNNIGFQDQPDLRYARIVGIEVLTRQDLLQNIPDAQRLLLGSFLNQIAITFETNDADLWNDQYPVGKNPNDTGQFRSTGKWIRDMPLTLLHRTQDINNTHNVFSLFEMNNLFITWQKSYITIPIPANISDQQMVCLQVYYTWRSMNGRLITH